jgi:hypothetical protein
MMSSKTVGGEDDTYYVRCESVEEESLFESLRWDDKRDKRNR